MRLCGKVSGAGSNGMTRLPLLEIDQIDDLVTDGKLDESKCRKLLGAMEGYGIQVSSDDGIQEFSFAIELMRQVRCACKRMVENRRQGSTVDVHEEEVCADDRHAKRNMNKDRVVYVRQDIDFSHVTGTMKLRIDIQNPHGIVGVAERIALDYAVIIARIANHIADEMVARHGSWPHEFKGGKGCPDVFEYARKVEKDLEEQERIKESNIAMWKCERRTSSGDCSPCKFDCIHYKNGKCVELEVKK